MKRASHGITLVETLVAVALIAIVMLSVSSYVVWTARAARGDNARQYVLQQSEYALDRMLQAVRNADSISTPSQGASGSTLVLSSNTPGDGAVTYAISDGQVMETKGGGSAVPITNPQVTFSNLAVTHRSDGTNSGVTISFSAAPTPGWLETEQVATITSSGSAIVR